MSTLKEVIVTELDPSLQGYWKKAQESVQLNNHKYAVTLLQAILKEAPGFYEGRSLLRECEGVICGLPGKKRGLFGSSIGSGGGGGGLGAMKIKGMAKKDPGGALVALEKELEKEPYGKDLNDLLHEIAKELNFPETAALALETVRVGHPEESKLLHKLANYYREIEKPTKAAEVYRHIVQHHPTDMEAVKGEKDTTANASMQRSRTDSGELVLKRVDTKESLELEQKSRAAMTKEQLLSKRDSLIAQYQEDANNLIIVKDLASTLEQLEDWEQSASFYSWAHQLSQGDSTLLNKANLMSDKAKDSQIESLEKAVEDNPNNLDLQDQLEELRNAHFAEQIESRRRRVEGNPTDPQLRFELGESLYALGEYSEAISHLQQATRNPHIRTKVLLTLGRTFDKKGMHDLAIKQLQDANAELTAMDGVKKEILYEMGLIYDKMSSQSEALECFKQIYEVDYGYRDVAQRVEQSY